MFEAYGGQFVHGYMAVDETEARAEFPNLLPIAKAQLVSVAVEDGAFLNNLVHKIRPLW